MSQTVEQKAQPRASLTNPRPDGLNRHISTPEIIEHGHQRARNELVSDQGRRHLAEPDARLRHGYDRFAILDLVRGRWAEQLVLTAAADRPALGRPRRSPTMQS